MIAAGVPQALLLVGPGSVGKTTLGLDIAAALFCRAENPADRPCRECRGCRLLAHGNHPDLHRLAPEGPGGQIVIGQVRSLIQEVALLPLEGPARVALVESAHRLNEDAQHTLLKTLEEPPAGLTLILAVDDEDALLPTVRSRCARVRLGPLPARAIEELLVEEGGRDPLDAAKIARLAGGRAGLALAYARSDAALGIRSELTRSLLDLFDRGCAARLAGVREGLARAAALQTALAPPQAPEGAPVARPGRRGPKAASAAPSPGAGAHGDADSLREDEAGPAAGSAVRGTAADRRRAAAVLVNLWREVVGDLVRVQLGDPGAVREPDLLEEYAALAPAVTPADLGRFLARLDDAAVRLDASAHPELLFDVLALRLPRRAVAA